MRKEVFKDDAMGSGLSDQKDRVAIDSNGKIQEEQVWGDGDINGKESGLSFGHVTLEVPFRHPRGDVTKAVGGVLVRDTNLDVRHIWYS